MRHVVSALLPLLLVSCGGDSGPPPVSLIWDPGVGELGAFPDDSFTVDDPAARTGLRLDLSPQRIPQVAALPDTFQQLFVELGTLDGFGLTAGIFVRFDGALDPSSLSSGPSTAVWGAPIVLVAGGAPWPYELTLTDEDRTVMLWPMRPLPPASRAFVSVTTRVRSADGRPLAPSRAMAAALRGDGIDAVTTRIAPRVADALGAQLAADPTIAAGEIVGVVPFTTQSVHEDALAVAADVAGRAYSPLPGTTCTPDPRWILCEGSFTAIDYRGGDSYLEDVGAEGPDADTTYDVPFTAWLPLDRPGPYGGEGYPTVVFGHGLGGERQQAERLAEFAAPMGLATVAIDALHHGDHPTAEHRATLTRILDFFALDTGDLTFDPLAMRDHFRQSSFDKLQLTRLVAPGVDLDGDTLLDLDGQRLIYLGVSLGGIMGPELLALAPEYLAAILIVPGGRVASIVSDAEQFSVLIDLMRPADATDGDVDRFFPVLQTLLERGDPAAWAPHILDDPAARPPGFPAAAPHLLMAMVIDDDTVPNSTNRVLARALDVPIVPPVRQEVGLVATTDAPPVGGNLPDGRTAGLLQFDLVSSDDGTMMVPATHSNVGDSAEGVAVWLRFIDTLLTDGGAEIIDPYGAP
jgi:hypothetical protein